MPSRPIHNAFTKMMFEKMGYQVDTNMLIMIDKINELIDKPHLYLGSKHRVLFHGLDGLALAVTIAKKFGYGIKEGMIAFFSHILLDAMESKARLFAPKKRNNRSKKQRYVKVGEPASGTPSQSFLQFL